MDTANNTNLSKLILLYIFDKMEMSLTESTITDLCSRNNWIGYMTCKDSLFSLVETGFLVESSKYTSEKDHYYTITTNGIACISYFFMQIPTSLREEISNFIKENYVQLKKSQEYFEDHYRNEDGTYTVILKILDQNNSVLELKLNVANKAVAKSAISKWKNAASSIYRNIYDTLIDE